MPTANRQHPTADTIIFDLGGVILDLSVDSTIEAFAALSRIPKERVYDIFVTSSGFNDYEKGLFGDDDFRQFVRDTYNVNSSDDEIDSCWNAMLRGLPQNKLAVLRELRKRYRIILLSNTNNIHLEYINGRLLPRTVQTLDDYFDKAYYSHRMFKRKPEAAIFQQVVDENALEPGRTLFLDDNALNVEAASRLGIKSVHVNTPDFILNYFNE